jgi:hypothetical protein
MQRFIEGLKQGAPFATAGPPSHRGAAAGPPLPSVLQLQRQAGNQAILGLMRSGAVVFDGNEGVVSAGVRTLPLFERPYRTEYDAGQGRFVLEPRETSNSVKPRDARDCTVAEERASGYRHVREWIFVEGPSVATGAGETTPGFAGVAYNAEVDVLQVIDNRLMKPETTRSTAALTRNLLENLDRLIEKVAGMPDMPSRIRILRLLREMCAALASGDPLPANTKLVVTDVDWRQSSLGDALYGSSRAWLRNRARAPEAVGADAETQGRATPDTTSAPGTTAGS